MSLLEIRQFPCLSDNYGYLIHDPVSQETAAIDTPDPVRILEEAEAAGWTLTQIWNTHHHHDHTGGNAALQAATGARLVAPTYETARIPDIDHEVADGDIIQLGDIRAKVLFTPGHTRGHVIYHFPTENVAFVGDTLFALGCGRLFEGTAAEMWHSLSRIRAFDPDTLIYCAHEYTQANARFARSIDPDNPDLKAYAETVSRLRSNGLATVPSRLADEIKSNPFLRADAPDLKAAIGMADADPDDVFAEVRRQKDQF
ncbi:hydroxyacylglutathione hydrolase [Maricaulis sp. D1M11]|uniref:hydroxyacylglutathione hydrolase n=1 Tax=Maricaulis sp. D1M11 TaxID=3076117 RepID=UPI0039B55850